MAGLVRWKNANGMTWKNANGMTWSYQWLSDWAHRIELVIDDTNIDSDLTDFPVLVYLSAASGIGDVDASPVFDELTSDANRKKIAVTSSDGETQLYVEIERWDDASEFAWLWVKVPSVLATGGATLYLYYDSTKADNTTYIGDTGDAAAQSVWDANFVAVYHMAQDPNGDPAGAILDSTSNANHGTPSGAMTSADLVAGLIGKAIDFDGGDDLVDLGSDAELDDLTLITIEATINPTGWGEGNSGRIIAKSAADNSAGWQFLVTDAGRIQLLSKWDGGAVAQWYTGNSTISLSSWQNVACTYDSTSTANDPILYIAGSPSAVTESPAPSGSRESDAGQTLKIASRGTDREFYGLIDEVRVSNIIRSAAWLKATHYSNTDAIVTFGIEETYTGLNDTTLTLTEAFNVTCSISGTPTIGVPLASTFDVQISMSGTPAFVVPLADTLNVTVSISLGNIVCIFRELLNRDSQITTVLAENSPITKTLSRDSRITSLLEADSPIRILTERDSVISDLDENSIIGT